MDETIRIYRPKHSEVAITKESKWKKFCNYISDGEVWKSVLKWQAKETRELGKKYPWFPIMYNWLIVALILGLFVSFCIWGVNIHTEKTAVAYAEAIAEQKDAEHAAERKEQIRREIAEIENRGLRASRAVALGIATEEDLNKLQEIESAIAELRAEYEAL